MSILFSVLAFIACCATGAGGAWGMRWYIDRNRVVADAEDPRDTQIRDLLAKMKVARDSVLREQNAAKDVTEHLEMAHERIAVLADRATTLSQKHAGIEAGIQEANSQNELLRGKLSVASTQVETLKQRTQELEMELRVSSEPDLLDAGNTVANRNDDDDELEAMCAPKVDDTSPSLIHALSAELERWKKHCHVLGDELKSHRERNNAPVDEGTMTNGVPFDSIDELTDIRGIGNALARKLHKLGIYRYDALLSMSDDDRERAMLLIPDFERRLQRDGWLEQARILHHNKYSETAAA